MKRKKDLLDHLNEGKKKWFIITAQPYRQDILFALNMSGKDIVKVMKRIHDGFSKEDEEYILGGGTGRNVLGTMYPLSKGFVIQMDWPKRSLRRNCGVIVHEIVHVVHYIFREIRLPLTQDSEEAYTYLIEKLYVDFLGKLY